MEDGEFETLQVIEGMPSAIGAFKNHPLYVLHGLSSLIIALTCLYKVRTRTSSAARRGDLSSLGNREIPRRTCLSLPQRDESKVGGELASFFGKNNPNGCSASENGQGTGEHVKQEKSS